MDAVIALVYDVVGRALTDLLPAVGPSERNPNQLSGTTTNATVAPAAT